MSEDLTKSEVRGRRNNKTKTVKREHHVFDDEKDLKGGRRGHAKLMPVEDDGLDDLEDFDPNIDWKKLIR
jgi:hypothetical protein